jgi:hypothetical protein
VTLSIQSSPNYGTSPPADYTFLGNEIFIQAVPGPVQATITFRIDSSVLSAAGADASTVVVFRDGTQVPECLPTDIGPCVDSRTTAVDGDAIVAIRTPHESTWNFGIHRPYAFSGFFQPVDNLPALNSVKAGRAIPVKFSLGGNKGLAVLVPGYPKSQAISCDSSAPVDAIEETVSAGASTLTYDSATNQYVYVWKTDSTWSAPSPCRQLTLRFIDGSTRRANFKFTK